jgi:hypothetical protein
MRKAEVLWNAEAEEFVSVKIRQAQADNVRIVRLRLKNFKPRVLGGTLQGAIDILRDGGVVVPAVLWDALQERGLPPEARGRLLEALDCPAKQLPPPFDAPAFEAARRALVRLDKAALTEIASGPTSRTDAPHPDAGKRQKGLNHVQA